MATTRRMRAFKRWMKSQGIDYSDALELVDNGHDDEGDGIYVESLNNLHVGDLIATIPKWSCLTIKTSGARWVIEEAGLEGFLGLAVALMYEKSRGPESPWFGYLQLLPEFEPIPLMWSLDDIDSLLSGTELHETVKQDRTLIYEDWKACILPLVAATHLELNPDYFGVQQYFAAKSLIASRSFEIDDYHGFGMVPLADLFNHKTDDEDVHFAAVTTGSESDNSADNGNDEYDDTGDGDSNSQSKLTSFSGCKLDMSSTTGDDPMVLEMIIVKTVNRGKEIFNTYGSLGNAALLHRYGFTEPDNPYDIVNIDIELVLQWSSSIFSCRHSRSRLSLWRKLNYSGLVSQNSEYFEISFSGEPQVELLVLLYIMLLSEEAYHELDLMLSTTGDFNKPPRGATLLKKSNIVFGSGSELSKNLLLTPSVCSALLSIADIRESFYASNSLEDDIGLLKRCCRVLERKLYHSLMLRISERRILVKLRSYATNGAGEKN